MPDKVVDVQWEVAETSGSAASCGAARPGPTGARPQVHVESKDCGPAPSTTTVRADGAVSRTGFTRTARARSLARDHVLRVLCALRPGPLHAYRRMARTSPG
ncbi:hypothetical protein GCM10020366_04670 [Saccharopolyspora gregorii]|uniref:Uncharacterized protein n=1 Tax=Saccharopolyspora gregorii TaxID=33914 RepID=A0ABP6RP97_9PSEU